MTTRNDSILLRHWTIRRDPDAFSELVTRYADQVYATCKRILGNDADAQDVAQECFFRLAQAAGDIRSSVGGWLHHAATTKSLDRLKTEARRRDRERAYHRDLGDAPEAEWEDIQTHVDEAIDALPDDLRHAVVAHFLDRKTHKAIARELHLSRSAVSYRIEKGIAAIRANLLKKGIGIGAVALTAALATQTAVASPSALTAALGKMSMVGSVNASAGASGLSKGILGGLIAMKLKVAGVCLVVCAIAAGLYYTSSVQIANRQDEADHQSTSLGTASSATPATVATKNEPTILPPAQGASETPSAKERSYRKTEDKSPTLPKKDQPESHYNLIADKANYTSVSGTISDEQGYGISGATVTLAPQIMEDPVFKAHANRYTAQSGADGSYSIDGIRYEGGYFVHAAKDGYADTLAGRGAGPAAYPLVIQAKSVNKNVNLVLPKGIVLAGRVVDAADKTVENASVQVEAVMNDLGGHMVTYIVANTDAKGVFSIGFSEAGSAMLRVTSDTQGSGTFKTEIQDDHAVDFKLHPIGTIYGIVLDKKGQPASGVSLSLNGQADGNTSSFTGQADSAGKFSIEVEGGLEYAGQVRRGPQALTAMAKIGSVGAGECHEWNPVVSGNLPTVRGRVLGEQSNQPIPGGTGGMRVVGLRDGERVNCSGGFLNDAGEFEIQPLDGAGRYQFQVDYDVYKPQCKGKLSAPLQLAEGEEKSIDLTAPEPLSATVHVVTAEGAPIAGAGITLLWISSGSVSGKYVTAPQTMADGRLPRPITFAPLRGFQFLIQKTGYVDATGVQHEEGQPGTVYPEEEITMLPAAGIEGTIMGPDLHPIPSTPVELTFTDASGAATTCAATTDANGHFVVLDKAPAGPAQIVVTAKVPALGGITTTTQSANLGAVTLVAGSITNAGNVVLHKGAAPN